MKQTSKDDSSFDVKNVFEVVTHESSNAKGNNSWSHSSVDVDQQTVIYFDVVLECVILGDQFWHLPRPNEHNPQHLNSIFCNVWDNMLHRLYFWPMWALFLA